MGLPKVIAVVGANASGKSAIGLELAQRFNGEIISADSRQIYRGFGLCSGKVSAEEARAVPHHLLDIKDVGELFSAADFQNLAYAIITDIINRGKTPFMVGGTGLYVKSVVYGYMLPEEPSDISTRDRLKQLSVAELRAMLTPEGEAFLSANRSDAQNKRRIIRVIEKTAQGRSLRPENAPRYNALQLGVAWPKETLHARIDERLAARIQAGMIDEVRAYLDGGGRTEHLYGLGLEYRYILWYLTGKFKSMDELTLELSQAIKRFAKRQMTWFKRDPSIIWLDMASDYLGQADKLIAEFLDDSRDI